MEKKQILLIKITFFIFFIIIIGTALYVNISNNKRLASYFSNQIIKVKTLPVKEIKAQPEIVMLPSALVNINLLPEKSDTVKAMLRGRLVTLNLTEGLPVKKGQIIGTIDVSEYEFQLKSKYAEHTALLMTLIESQKDLERYEHLYKQGAVSEQQYGHMKAALETAKSKLQQNKSDTANLLQNINRASIIAPIDGIIYHLFIKQGSLLDIGMPVCDIANAGSKVNMLLSISENEKHYFSGNETITIKPKPNLHQKGLLALKPDFTLQGTVQKVWMNTQLPASQWMMNVELNNLAKDFFPLLTKQLFNGQNAEYEVINSLLSTFFDGLIIKTPAKQMLVLPAQAILVDRNMPYVFVISENGYAHKKVVELGAYNNKDIGLVDILSGLNLGEQVVISGQDKLNDGDEVEIEAIVQPSY